MTERPDPAKVIPGPDPGACPSCGEWRKSGMIHNCGNNPVNDPAKVIAEALAEKLHWLADPERAQELAEAVLAALAAEGFPVGEPRDVGAIIERLAEKAWRDADVTTYPSRAGERPFHGRHMNVVRLSFAVAAVREAAQPDAEKPTPRSELRRIAAVEGVCPICAARPVPAPDSPPVTLAFWECGHIEVDRGRSHACPLDVCGATYAAYAPVADGDVIRADERERLSARVYENGWCLTCGKKAVVT